MVSLLNPTIITEENVHLLLESPAHHPGCRPCTIPFGQVGDVLKANVKAMDPAKLIPREAWPDLISAKDAAKSWIADKVIGNVKTLDQNGTNYCHAYGAVQTVRVALFLADRGEVDLSAQFVGGETTGWRNAGAMPVNDFKVMMEQGIPLKSYQDKEYSFSPSRWKDGYRENALEHRVLEVTDGRISGKTFDAATTACLCDEGCEVGFGWWSHAIHGPIKVIYKGSSAPSERTQYEEERLQFCRRLLAMKPASDLADVIGDEMNRLTSARGVFEHIDWNNWGTTQEFPQFAEGRGTPDLGVLIPRVIVESKT